MLAVLFLTATQVHPARAGTPAWMEAVADIAELRDEAIADLLGLVADYEDYLITGPTAEDAAAELRDIKAQIDAVVAEAGANIRSIMSEYPKAPQVQEAGAFAIGLVGLAHGYSVDRVTVAFDQYVAGSPGSTTTTTLPPVTTTTLPPVTTTTAPPVVTTTTLPPVTTTTLPPVVTTTTLPPVTTTTAPPVVTTTTSPPVVTTTTAPPVVTTTLPPTTTTTVGLPTTTTTTLAAGGGADAAQPPASVGGIPRVSPGPIAEFGGRVDALGSGDGPLPVGDPVPFDEPGLSSPFLADQRGLTASLTRILEPVLPASVADVVVSPLFVFELLWRAISSSGRGLVMPIALLVFSVISLLWDRRSKRLPIAT